MEDVVIGTVIAVMNWMKTHYAWDSAYTSITIWDFCVGVFITEGIMYAFRLGLRRFSEDEGEK